MGTTVATNALLERTGAKTAFVVTQGFKDLLVIGNQSRPKMFDLAINRPGEVYSKVVEVSERVTLEAWSESQEPEVPNARDTEQLVTGITGEKVRILSPIGKLRPCEALDPDLDAGMQTYTSYSSGPSTI